MLELEDVLLLLLTEDVDDAPLPAPAPRPPTRGVTVPLRSLLASPARRLAAALPAPLVVPAEVFRPNVAGRATVRAVPDAVPVVVVVVPDAPAAFLATGRRGCARRANRA